jgi:hypothetical protein
MSISLACYLAWASYFGRRRDRACFCCQGLLVGCLARSIYIGSLLLVKEPAQLQAHSMKSGLAKKVARRSQMVACSVYESITIFLCSVLRLCVNVLTCCVLETFNTVLQLLHSFGSC